ncbi:peptidylprolyl isomerase [Altererythrobacter sp. HHU K3-1]|uniref:Parvulin-like PPIase n=1 Tax=Qipengyuania atrilutea TaxID=2744473 RepID=A0A850H107_9SPHN|nr:peptidylprolyl isomerase [Actirhodobacter atriluteus]
MLACSAGLSLAASPALVQAQAAGQPATNPQVQDAADDNPLGIPDSVQILGKSDPNLRTATALVNGTVITGTDIDQRVALVTSASEAEIPPDEMVRLRQQVLRNLIDETLQIQAAEAQELAVTDEQVNAQYLQLAAQNFGQEPEKMDAYLTGVGSSPASLKRQIKGELAWSSLIRQNVSPFINVAAEEVNDVLTRMEQSRGTEEYRLGEIYLSATPANREAVLQNAQRIIEQLRQGGSFVAYARQFSEASTAVVGGDLGFVRLGQLPGAISSAAATMQPGQLNGPIEVPGGYSIIYLIDKRQVLMADPRDALLSLKQISIGFPAGISQADAQARLEAFGTGVEQMRGCGDADQAAAALGATVVTNDQIRVRALPEQLQNIVLGLQLGQTTPPFGSIEEGVRVLMLCGRDDPEQSSGPNFEQVMNQLEEERINKRAQRYLRDLRNDAFIEYN